jgi:perosamine synthetase
MTNKMKVPLACPDVDETDIQAVREVLMSGSLALGPEANEFERAMVAYIGCTHAVAVNSGTSALHLIVRGLGIGPGDEVITTPFSFVASTNCILFEGATPVFVDIEPTTLCIDPARIEAAITPRTKAILAVDVFGHPADWTALESIAECHDLLLIEDSAEALGSELRGKRCGSFGRAGVFGFYPNKQITTGEGGMIVTDDADLAGLCRSMANQGRGEGGWLSHVRLGYNYRMDEMSAALGATQLRRLGDLIVARARVASWYEEALSSIREVEVPRVMPDVKMSWFVYVVRLADRFSRQDRDHVLASLRAEGIGCRDYFEPIHLQPFLRERLGTGPGQHPVTESVGDRTIALPFFPQMAVDQVRCVVESLSDVLAGMT